MSIPIKTRRNHYRRFFRSVMQARTPPRIAKYLFKRNIQTPLGAVTLGLYLALTAPTEDKCQAVLQMTDDIIENAGLSEQDVDTAKAIALAQFQLGEER